MSSDLSVSDYFLSEPFPPFTDSSIDVFLEFQENINNSSNLIQEKNPLDETNSFGKTSSIIFSPPSSPPSFLLEDIFLEFQENIDNSSNLIQEKNPLDETNSFGKTSSIIFSPPSSPPSFQLENFSISHLENANYPFSEVKMKSEELPVPESFSCHDNSIFTPQSYDGGSEIAMKFMQRSFSSNSLDGKQNNLFHPGFDFVSECSNSLKHIFNPPETSFSSGAMRRVCSTGDLQKMRTKLQTKGSASSSSPLSMEKSFMGDANFKVRRYSAEERKERIQRYRAKRSQRNFNKTIKYTCRKTLADNRPRIRGRFVKYEEAAGEIPKASISNRYEDEDDLWTDGLLKVFDEELTGGEPFFNDLVQLTDFDV